MSGPVLVVLVNFRLADHIERLLASGALSGHRVLLVDNASQPKRIRHLAEVHGTEALLLDRNYGFAGAVNRAVAYAVQHGPVLLLNPDVCLDSSVLPSLHRTLVERGLTGVAPLLLNPDGSVQVGTAGGPTSLAGFARYFLFISHVVPAARGVFYTRHQLVRSLPPEWVSMACLLLEADAFERYGPVPEDELVYAEDVAWGQAASRSGARFAVVADVRVTHQGGEAGASRRWTGALARLAIREHGEVRGRLAASVMWVGLGMRRLVGRKLW